MKVKLTDTDDALDTKTFSVHARNLPPTATLSNDGPVVAGGSATIRFSNAADASQADTTAGFHCEGSAFGTPPTYAATTGDATTACEFQTGGQKTVRAAIVDKDGGFSVYTTDVEVDAAAPVLTAPAAQSAVEGGATDFALGSFTEAGAGAGPWNVEVDWGDGTSPTTFQVASPGSLGSKPHTYADGPATRSVAVKVTNAEGAGDTGTFDVTVGDVAPTVKLDPGNAGSADEGQTQTYAYAIADPGADTVGAVETSCGANGQKLSR